MYRKISSRPSGSGQAQRVPCTSLIGLTRPPCRRHISRFFSATGEGSRSTPPQPPRETAAPTPASSPVPSRFQYPQTCTPDTPVPGCLPPPRHSPPHPRRRHTVIRHRKSIMLMPAESPPPLTSPLVSVPYSTSKGCSAGLSDPSAPSRAAAPAEPSPSHPAA